MDQVVDWDLAEWTAARLVRPGPVVSRDEAEQVVGELRTFADQSTGHVARTALLDTPPGSELLVVDRAGWARANVAGFRAVLAPSVERAWRSRDSTPGALAAAVGSRVTGAEVGSLLAFLASRVLGQYDVFAGLDDGTGDGNGDGPAAPAGRLLLVAPNVVHVERELEVDPRDFRLWVCLHEETHRVQFAATPWLRDHLVGQVRALADDLVGDPAATVERFTTALRNLPDAVRGTDGAGVIDLLQTPEQRRALAETTAVMSLLEGHADVVMDDVGPQVIPTVAEIRRRFGRRRAGRGALDQVLRRLLGLEAKMRQYADGARFVRGVVDDVGWEGLNQVWTGPEALPSPEEIAEPGAWVRRVHG